MPAQPACFHRLDEILALLRGFDTRYLDRQAGQEAVERYARTDAPFRRRSGHTPPGGHRRSRFVCDQVGDRTANNCNKC